MTKYLFAYHGGNGMPETPEEGQRIMAAWTKWMGDLGPNLVDVGNPVGPEKLIAKDGMVSDGGGANPITGYSIVEASSMDAALKLAQTCPVLASGGSVEVGETFNAM